MAQFVYDLTINKGKMTKEDKSGFFKVTNVSHERKQTDPHAYTHSM